MHAENANRRTNAAGPSTRLENSTPTLRDRIRSLPGFRWLRAVLMISNYVCPSKAHYPIEWRRFKKRDACPTQEFKDHTELGLALIDEALKRGIPGTCTFESYFTNAKMLNHLQRKQAAYVGDLKLNIDS